MQEKCETPRDFLRRTDLLAARLGCSVQELPDKLGFSRASLFAYRAGKRTITPKAWLRLAEVEQKTFGRKSQQSEDSLNQSQRMQSHRDTVHLPYDTDPSARISEESPDMASDAATAAHSMPTSELVTALHDMIDGLAAEKYSFLRPQRAATIRALLAELAKRE